MEKEEIVLFSLGYDDCQYICSILGDVRQILIHQMDTSDLGSQETDLYIEQIDQVMRIKSNLSSQLKKMKNKVKER